MREVGSGIAAILVLVVIGAHLWGGPIPTLWVHALAHECPDGSLSPRCVDTLAATVTGHTTTEAGVDMALAVPERGELHATLPAADVERLAVADHDEVRAAVLDTEVLRLTGDNGETAAAVPRLDVAEALLRFLAVSAGAIALVCVVALASLRRRGSVWWLRPVVGCTAVGTAVGIGAGSLASLDLVTPVLFGVTALTSLAGAYVWTVRLRVRQA